ncbi:hypothetical protein ZYGR_0U01170 [Zygosaccharomyces rouxii]|uniref:Uncharacterized protein n=1 Tax=Zygosaccharomyces rouxii TaxID=4956 RepID=A0A1Q3A3G0_ZYGRO|nr:hypothetical protein ZYGR_0U01170 [Zygosaccharomyces rouxii]
MHYSSHSTSSAPQEYAKENENTEYGDVGIAMAHYKQRQGQNQQAHQHQHAPFQQHRVALSDVTSQVSNRMYINNASVKQLATTSTVENGGPKRASMGRNERYVAIDELENKQLQSQHKVQRSVDQSEVYVDVLKRNEMIGNEHADAVVEDQTEVNEDDEEEEEEDEEDDDDDSDDDSNEPLSPVFNERSEAILDQAFREYHRDSPDPLDDDTYDVVMVSELSTEIFEYLRELEMKYRPNPSYMDIQPELKWSYRSTLIDWIIQVHSRFQLLPETLYLTVNIIDRFLSRKTVTLNRFQLVGAAALFVAAKYEEINCPTLNDIVYMLDHAYTKEDIVKAEKFMIDTLDFEIGWPGPFSFLRRISKADDYEYDTRTLAKYLLETTTMDSKLVAAPPSWLATGAYFLSRIILGCNEWTLKHIYYSGYTQEQIFPLATVILENCRFAERRHQAIWKKYSERRQHRSAQVVAKWIALAERRIDQSSI